jgi:serine/threonine protein kinase
MNEREIFQEALDRSDPAQRLAYLDHACGTDAALRARVEALLVSHVNANQFLNVPAWEQINPHGGGRTVDSSPTSGGTANEGKDSRSDVDAEDDPHTAPDLSFLQPAAKPGSIGMLGHYEILQVLGRGAFGIVFKAFDEKLHRLVAIKVINPPLAATSPPRKRFLREARSAAKIKHENIVQVYSVEEHPLPYLVMEYIDGQTLKQKLDNSGPLEVPEVLHLGRQMASGLAAAHAQGLIHRDIKPANILLEQGAELKVKITDFGLARAADDASMTRTGLISGTPMYMAPEQALGLALDHRTDLFSLGSVLYQMASGRPPFRATTAVAVLRRVTDETPRPIQEILAEVPDWLCVIIAKLHAKKPSERFQSARELADLLARCLAAWQQHGRIESLGDVLPMIPQTASVTPESVESEHPTTARQTESALDLRPASNRRWFATAVVIVALLCGLSLSEAIGVTNVHGTIIRLFSSDGTRNGRQMARVSPEGERSNRYDAVEFQAAATVPTVGRNADIYAVKPYWSATDGELLFGSGEFKHHWLFFGNKDWTDYDFQARVCRTAGMSAFSLMFRSMGPNVDNTAMFTLGSAGNRRSGVHLNLPGEYFAKRINGVDLPVVWGEKASVTTGRWYTVKVEVRGSTCRCFVDGELRATFDKLPFPHGRVGLRIEQATFLFRDLMVTGTDGTVLWNGLPDMPASPLPVPATFSASPRPNASLRCWPSRQAQTSETCDRSKLSSLRIRSHI